MIGNEDHWKQSGAIVTGGANGVGRAICRLLASRGVETACIDIDQSAMNVAEGHTFYCDVRDPEQLEKTVKLAESAINRKYLYLFSVFKLQRHLKPLQVAGQQSCPCTWDGSRRF